MADGSRVRRRRGAAAAVVIAVAAMAACGGARFHRVGPVTPAATAAAGPVPISIERIELRWSNAYLISRGIAKASRVLEQ